MHIDAEITEDLLQFVGRFNEMLFGIPGLLTSLCEELRGWKSVFRSRTPVLSDLRPDRFDPFLDLCF